MRAHRPIMRYINKIVLNLAKFAFIGAFIWGGSMFTHIYPKTFAGSGIGGKNQGIQSTLEAKTAIKPDRTTIINFISFIIQILILLSVFLLSQSFYQINFSLDIWRSILMKDIMKP